ncbi:MAG: type VI secretion protein VgrG [Flavobacteriales bacterium]|nr:type VI secretion protein VgrG [Flavobacteriales bacterium]|tara:strand:- start:18156 stop:19901 length:1746 start_codon:yes stop_codon:yes gene_type:complete
MPISPLIEETNVFSFSILSAGSEIPSTYEIMSMNITMGISKLSSAEITVRDGSSASQTFEVTDSDTFKPGTEIEIKLGYQSKNDSIFKGVVTKESITVSEGSVSSLKISCKDKAEVLTMNKEKATYLKKKDSEIIQEIIGNVSGLTADVTATTLVNEEIVKPKISDWDFINMLAEKNGMIVTTDAGKVTVAVPDVSATPELQIQFGYDMIEFDSEINATEQYSGVECSAFDPATQKMITATAKDPTVNKEGDLTGSTLSSVLSANPLKLTKSAPLPQDELQAWADATLQRLRLSQFTGTVTFHGSPKAKVNSLIKLLGLSDRFNGDSYISGITHSISGDGWTTTAEIGMSSESFAEKNELLNPGSDGVSPPVHGLQTGIVKKINADPNNEFRVQVQLPILGDDSDPIWARLSTFYAGNTFGAYFMPEVDDEVILGFMDDNPSYPIILGSVFSSKIPAPETPDEKNTIKTLITSSKLQLKFDDENKVFTILTPGGNTMVFSDKDKGITVTDQNKNKIEMKDAGITLTDKSNNTIEMTSSGITINSKSKLTLKAAQEVDVQGASISVSADGSTAIKGSTVAIN